MTMLFPFGEYKIFSSYDLQDIKYDGSNLLLSTGTRVFGLLLVRILCPSNLKVPFLHCFSEKQKRMYLCCCKKCADLKLKTCNHTER